MRGGGSNATMSKWTEINTIVRDNKISILALQETHLQMAEKRHLNGLFERQIHIINSEMPGKPNVAGVAVVLSKKFVAWRETKHWEVIPGQALLVQIPWKNNREQTCTFLAIYAPNEMSQNRDFWASLRRKLKKKEFPKPDIVMGNFNIVEDLID